MNRAVEIVGGPADGLIFPIQRSEVVIGRDTRCDIAISNDRLLDRKHCRICRNDDEYYVEHIGSNGETFISRWYKGDKQAYWRLHPQAIEFRTLFEVGQIIRIGATEFRLIETG